MSDTGRWQTIEHTGDLGITIESPSLAGLFATAAAALAGVLLGEESGSWGGTAMDRGEAARAVTVEAADREALLIDWLRELLYIQMSERVVVSGVAIRELSEDRIAAALTLEPLSRERNIERELKAVTYHDAEVDERENGWFARIVFDI